MRRFLPLALLALTACGPKAPPAPPVQAGPPEPSMPGPLAKRPFTLPAPATAELSNGLKVVLVENHEVPLVYVRLVVERGGYTDPDDKIGLASVTFDMMDEGAGGLSAAELSREAQRLGASIGAGGGADGGAISLSTLKRTLPDSLDLLSKVVLEPTFSRDDWKLLQKKRIQSLAESKEDPNSVASRVYNKLHFGDVYKGRMATEEGYDAIGVPGIRRWHKNHVGPATTTILVGGDTTLDEIQPLLEERFGAWSADTIEAERPQLTGGSAAEPGTIYFIDKPGAAQSVVRAGLFVGEETDDDWFALNLANLAYGGAFTARLNMNLREDKGITYGARSGISHSYAPGLWTASSSIVTDGTTLGVTELLREIEEMRGDRTITEDELANARGGLLGTWPLNFENPGYLLNQTVDQMRYGRGADWLSQLVPRYEAVSLEAANAAFSKHIDPSKLVLLVVGDAEKVQAPLAEATGLPVVSLDADGNIIE